MTAEEVVEELKPLGRESYKRVLIPEPAVFRSTWHSPPYPLGWAISILTPQHERSERVLPD
jgi:hypothetical protein